MAQLGTNGRGLTPRKADGNGARPDGVLSIEEQIQAAADRYAADIRAAGARYEAAMNRILARHQPKSIDHEQHSIANITGD
jgi:hypothetical protein